MLTSSGDSTASKSRRLMSVTFTLVAVLLLLTASATPAVAASDGDGDGVKDSKDQCKNSDTKDVNSNGCETSGANKNFLCTSSGEAQPSAEGLVGILQNIVGAFMVIGPVAGIMVALYASVAQSAKTEEDSSYSELRRNSILIGFGVPIAAYGLEALSGAILGFNIACIIP